MNFARKLRIVESCPMPEAPIRPVIYGAPSWSSLTPLQRDKCFGRRLIASGGDFGITYAAPIRQRSRIKTAFAMFPFIAFVALTIVAVVTGH